MLIQFPKLAERLTQHAYVLQTGRIVPHGAAAELRTDPRIRDAYLGGQDAQ